MWEASADSRPTASVRGRVADAATRRRNFTSGGEVTRLVVIRATF